MQGRDIMVMKTGAFGLFVLRSFPVKRQNV